MGGHWEKAHAWKQHMGEDVEGDVGDMLEEDVVEAVEESMEEEDVGDETQGRG